MFREWEKLIQGTEPPTVSSVSAQVQGVATAHMRGASSSPPSRVQAHLAWDLAPQPGQQTEQLS